MFFRSAPSARMGRCNGQLCDGAWSIASRTSQDGRTKSSYPCDGIVHPACNGPLTDQECIGDSGKTRITHLRLRRRSVRSSGWHWSSPEFRERLRRRADGAAACKGSITPNSSFCGATPQIVHLSPRASTMGRAGEVSRVSASRERSTRRRATSRSLAMRANGFSLRYFRSRKAATAAGFRASQAR